MNSPSNLPAPLHIPFLMPLLALLSGFPPLSTDMYLPIIPHLGELWGVDLKIINLTLICFFLSYSPALLVYGPISDRFGRKKPLLTGLFLFILGSFLCATATSPKALILARILQGIGAAGPSALGLSIIKDYYTGLERKKILAMIGIIVSLAVLVGPTMGSWLLLMGSWQIIFILQAVVAIIAFTGVVRIPETHTNKKNTPFRKMAGAYLSLFRNSRFLSLTLLFAASMCPFFAFIAGSADIYIIGFTLSEQAFGLFFGINALFLMSGSLAYVKFATSRNDLLLLRLGFGGILAGGMLLMVMPHSQILCFTLPMSLISFCFGLTRPLSMNLILETVDQDIGSASSLMMFSNFIFGALAMWIISLGGPWKITIIGLMAVLSGIITLFALWFLLQEKPGVKETETI